MATTATIMMNGQSSRFTCPTSKELSALVKMRVITTIRAAGASTVATRLRRSRTSIQWIRSDISFSLSTLDAVDPLRSERFTKERRVDRRSGTKTAD